MYSEINPSNYSPEEYLAILIVKGHLLETQISAHGVFYLYGSEDKYIEVYMANDVRDGRTMILLTDLDRIADYSVCWWRGILGGY